MAYAEARLPHLRVRLFPQSPYSGSAAGLETVLLSARAGEVGPGPSDRRAYTIEALAKTPYGARASAIRPPWRGPTAPPAAPAPDGQFDRFLPSDPGFRQVHLYGCVCFALDVWEKYLGTSVPWHFTPHYSRLELAALGPWANAHMGYGFLEVGMRPLEHGGYADLALDFDVIGHEIGHGLMMAFAGEFDPARMTADYAALHEASADWASMIAALHFKTVLVEVLETTRGDLYTANHLVRFAEFSHTRQIRRANNRRTLWDLAGGFTSEHDAAEPLIGGLFDAFVEIYKEFLVMWGAIPRSLDAAAQLARVDRRLHHPVRRAFARAYADHPQAFVAALEAARDVAAMVLVRTWKLADPTSFRLADLPVILQSIDLSHFGGALGTIAAESLRRRGIGIIPLGPRLAPPASDSLLRSERTWTPRSGMISAI